jgi:hypothetical protein
VTVISGEHATLPAEGEPLFFAISVRKLVILGVCSFGLYVLYWFYRNWCLVRDRSPFEEISPGARTFWSVFTANSLFTRMRNEARQAGLEFRVKPGELAVIYFALAGIASQLPDPWWLISLASVAPIAYVQQVVNATHAVTRPLVRPADGYRWGEWAIIYFGGTFVALVIVTTFFPLPD